jgi:hypothetical protein
MQDVENLGTISTGAVGKGGTFKIEAIASAQKIIDCLASHDRFYFVATQIRRLKGTIRRASESLQEKITTLPEN